MPVDPNLAIEKARADADQVRALQTQAQGDTASIMARYGTRLALAGAGSTGGLPNVATGGMAPNLSQPSPAELPLLRVGA